MASAPVKANLNIVINAGPTLQANTAALAAFNAAAQEWDSKIGNNITVNISADLSSDFANNNIIGSTSNMVVSGSYSTIRNQLVSVAAGIPGDSIVASLPTASQFSIRAPTGSSLSGSLEITQANAKALGFTVNSPNTDATIKFNSNFAFDYDRSNGVDPNEVDFQTVAAHEIGHVLGFISDLDSIDGGQKVVTPSTLDLYRFAAGAAPTTATQFETATRSLVPGEEEVTSDTVLDLEMSTGAINGDGNQGAHWKDDAITGINLGIMDPTLSDGVYFDPGPNDFRAMELIGWDVIPEPTSLALIALAAMPLRRRRFRKVSGPR